MCHSVFFSSVHARRIKDSEVVIIECNFSKGVVVNCRGKAKLKYPYGFLVLATANIVIRVLHSNTPLLKIFIFLVGCNSFFLALATININI